MGRTCATAENSTPTHVSADVAMPVWSRGLISCFVSTYSVQAILSKRMVWSIIVYIVPSSSGPLPLAFITVLLY